MFEKEAQNMKQKILSHAIGKEQVPLSEILSWDIPQSAKDYFKIFSERILSEEILSILYSKRFDQTNTDFIEARKRLINTLKNAILLNYPEFEDAADKASKFAINFVLRPEWTLSKVIFKDEDTKTKERILDSLLNFNEYAYYRKLIERIFEKYPSNEIKLELFLRILRKIDEEVIKSISLKEIISIVEPIFKLFEFANDEKTVPAEALIIFFNDKGIETIVKEIELEKDLHGRPRLTLSDVEIILKRSLKIEEIPVFITEKVEMPQQEEVKEPEIVAEAIEQKTEPTQKTKLPDLNLLFDEKTREKFIKKIFKKDFEKFNRAIEKLNSIETWKEASAFIDTIFIENEIDPYSDEAVEFTDLIYRRYIPGMK